MTLTAYFFVLFVSLAVLFGLTVGVAAAMGWWIEFRAEERTSECQLGKGAE
jgi:hypothetical protein